MLKKYIMKIIGLLFAVAFVLCFVNIKLDTIFQVPNNTFITISDLAEINENAIFGNYVRTSLNEDLVGTGETNKLKGKLQIKLFGIFTIKEIDVEVEKDRKVFLGGVPLGFSINTKGLIVVGNNSVSGEHGLTQSKKSSEIKAGDIIVAINDVEVKTAKEVKELLNKNTNEKIVVSLIRNNEIKKIEVTPIIDSESGEPKIGLWVRNNSQGVGTLTFMDNNKKFGALGHSIVDFETGAVIPIDGGNVYNCNIIGISKGERGKAGELRCLFMQGKNSKGTLDKNTKCGVFGDITDSSQIIDENFMAGVGSRLSMKLGEAKIVSSIEGIRQEYDIEIIKLNYQPSSNDKSFIFRVKDKRLINVSGGIVQGMSGSPIIQDGKLVGAVTHVFLNDPTKGYGVYSDWMMQEVA